jgi:hypothetical protein
MKTQLLKLNPVQFCKETNACADGEDFAAKHKTMAEVWDNCPKVDWLTWILDAIDAPHDEKAMRLFACWCVRNTPLEDGRKVWDLLTDDRSRNAVAVAERFANSEATGSELHAAWDAARDAARDAAWDAAGVAARDAAWVARDAAWAAAWAAAGDTQVRELRRVVPNPFLQWDPTP